MCSPCKNTFSRSGFTNGYIEGKISGAMFGVRTPEDTAASKAAIPAIRELYRREAQRVPVAFTVTVAESGCTLAAADGAGRRAEVSLAGAMEPARADQRPAIEKALAKTGGTDVRMTQGGQHRQHHRKRAFPRTGKIVDDRRAARFFFCI